ncbi:putative AAA+ superfamily ATPase [Caldicoprobacter guelmensis]|uniref:ATP-binding protein n=1 Tax=Caldicoprobacter guelmensis TaxID=1170224 RepID=UPI001956FDDD|nr:DUF499 domain-containing protein [Caldicoprobacter guelmensis]MBM7582561.1 putative AAA+ superfamily ATPase [Caldicoprobacter guelmensis]
MSLPAWWQVVRPHEDIKKGTLSESIFAADLGDVLIGTAPEEYKDPRLFFGKTYLTQGLKSLIRNVVERLTIGQGDPIIQLQTPFGGGKTHALLSLYHLVKTPGQVSHFAQIRELLPNIDKLSGQKVAAFVGTMADPIRGRTPWGAIAEQLGCYEVVKEHDKMRIAPGKERLKEILQKSGPALILIDELLEYVVKANRFEKEEKITQGQTLAFMQELSEVVATSDRSVLVVTLPASILEQYDEEAEKALMQLQKVLGRVESIYVPVEGIEIYEVIRKRLFEDLGDVTIHRQVAEAYFKLYQSLGNDVPREVRETAYREKIERAYPFHPEFIDVLYERWGSFQTFQRTRGVLRLLANVVKFLYDRRVSAPLIQSSMVELSDIPVRQEFIKHIGNEYNSVVDGDITGKAVQIDKEMGSEYEKYGIAKGLATSVFLYSFSGRGSSRGVNLPWLRVALLREGIPSTIVGDAVDKLEEALWYFHAEGRTYSFKNQPNLNRVIIDKEALIEVNDINDYFDKQLKRMLKGPLLDVYVWPRATSDIPDNRSLKLVVLSPEFRYGDVDTEKFVKELFDYAGVSFRIYRNTLFVVALDTAVYINLEQQIRRYLALKSIAEDASIPLAENAKIELQNRLKRAEDDIPDTVINAYRHIGWRSNGSIIWKDMGIATVGQYSSLTARIMDYLKKEERVLSSITVKAILDRGFAKDEEEKTIQEIYDVFLKTPGLPCLEKEDVLFEAVKNGVMNGLVGLRAGNRLYYREPFYSGLSVDMVVVKPERAEIEKEKSEAVPKGEVGGQIESPKSGFDIGGVDTRNSRSVFIPAGEQPLGQSDAPVVLPSNKMKGVYMKVTVPWDKISQIVNGVFRPLIQCGSELQVTVEIEAQTQKEIDSMTLENKVKETLRQINAQIVEWKELK